MYVRLAFAVAAHLDPEILVVDEVLAVGDGEFQRKCLGKMGKIAGEGGRTVLLVSHNLPAVSSLCSVLITLTNGSVSFQGDPRLGISQYYSQLRTNPLMGRFEYRPQRICAGHARLKSARLLDEDGNLSILFRQDQEIRLEISVEVSAGIHAFRLGIRIHCEDGTVLLTSSTADTLGAVAIEPGLHVQECHIPKHFLNSGTFFVTIAADVPMQTVLFLHEFALRFEVLDLGGLQAEIPDKRAGLLRCQLPWHAIKKSLDGPSAEDEHNFVDF
jgi:lipopolysaccharide transport system ATP-binding protein